MITSLTITRRSNRYWTTQSSEDVSSLGSSYYSGTRKGDYLTIKTFTGGIIYPSVPYNVVHYIDTVESANTVMTFISGEQLEGYLIEQNFYPPIDVNSGGGSGGVDRLTELLDSFIPNYIGREGKFIRVNLAGTGFEATNNPLQALRFQDLVNVPDVMPRNKLVMTSNIATFAMPGFPSQSNGIIFVDPINYINRPPEFSEGRIIRKGYIWQDGGVVENEENYVTEVGDICDRIFIYAASDDYPYGQVLYMPFGRYKGGDENSPNSYVPGAMYGMPFDTDPDKEED